MCKISRKTCRRCHREKPLSEYPYHGKTRDNLSHICRDCKAKVYVPKNRRRRASRDGHVYLLQADNGLCKIGITGNLDKRIRIIQTQSPIPVSMLVAKYVANAYALEDELHRQFADKHSHGEWLSLTTENIEYAKERICNAK